MATSRDDLSTPTGPVNQTRSLEAEKDSLHLQKPWSQPVHSVEYTNEKISTRFDATAETKENQDEGNDDDDNDINDGALKDDEEAENDDDDDEEEEEEEEEEEDKNDEEEDDDDLYPELSQVTGIANISTVCIPFYEDLTKSATLRTSLHPNEPQRFAVTSRGNKSLRYKSLVTLNTVVHGFIDAEATPKVPATLIGLECQLSGLVKNKPNYARVYVELQFDNDDPMPAQQQPFVLSYAPFKKHPGYDQVSVREQKVKTAYKVSGAEAGAMGASARIDGDIGQEKEEIRRKTYFRQFQAGLSSIKSGLQGCDCVWWDVQQNQHIRKGIPLVLKLGILVQRSHETSKFKAKFFMGLETGFFSKISNAVEKWFGITGDNPIPFDPTMEARGCPQGVDRDKLGKVIEMKNLGGLGGYQDLMRLA